MIDRPASSGEWTVLAGSVALLISSVLPWVTVTGTTLRGTDDAGLLTIGFGVALLAIVPLRNWSRIDAAATTGVAALSLLFVTDVFLNLESLMVADRYGDFVDVSAEIGLYAAIAASAVALVGGVLGLREGSANEATSTGAASR